MRLDVKFRLSIYLSLLLASACLNQAEEFFLPVFDSFTIVMIVLFAAAFLLEGRWALTIAAANILGIVIAGVAGCWILSRILHSSHAWHVALLSCLGPVLMCLLLAQLFRPKQIREFWQLHLVGLMEVFLGCVLASEPLFGFLLAGYLVCGIWSLALFHAYREQLRSAGRADVPLPDGWFPIRRNALWMISGSVLALFGFLCTPQMSDSSWSPFLLTQNGPIMLGYADGMDLNRTGRIKPSNLVAFEVVVTRDGDGRFELSDDQHWRGAILDHYERGRWLSRLVRRSPRPPLGSRHWRCAHRADELPPQAQLLSFVVPIDRDGQIDGLFLAEPVLLPPRDGIVPVLGLPDSGKPGWHFQPEKQILIPEPVITQAYEYIQAVVPASTPGLSSRLWYDPRDENLYVQQPIPGIRAWTVNLLRHLRDEGKFDRGEIEIEDGLIHVAPEHWEKLGRRLADHLSSSGAFTYSLQLTRKDLSLDPNEDFLRNLRQGHCERYASALTLMLRSCNIPARIVAGFHGVEQTDEDGRYLVRQHHAHTWVEMAVPRPGSNGQTEWHWLTLDPTPGDDRRADAGGSAFHWAGWQHSGVMLWRYFILDYNAERRNEASEGMASLLRQRWQDLVHTLNAMHAERLALLFLIACATVLTLLRLLRRRRDLTATPRAAAIHGFVPYDRLLDLCARHFQLRPRTAQTPLEFAHIAGQILRGRIPDLADVPELVVRLFYTVRYGRQTLDTTDDQDLTRRLDQIEQRLATGL